MIEQAILLHLYRTRRCYVPFIYTPQPSVYSSFLAETKLPGFSLDLLYNQEKEKKTIVGNQKRNACMQ